MRAMLIALLALSACAPPTPAPSDSPALEPTPTAPPSTVPAADLPLSTLAWWNNQYIGFGFTDPPPSDATPPPEDYKLLRVGTLDGRVSAELRLNPDHSHSSVSGPSGTDVVVANDDGSQTSVFVISATDGARTDLLGTGGLVPAAILSGDGQTLLFVKVDRATGADSGLWSRPRAGGAETELVPGPLGEPMSDAVDDLTRWWLTLSPDGDTIVVQWCHGGVTCRTHLVDLATGDRREATGAGWPIGITDTVFVADGLPPHNDEIVAIDLASGETRTLVESGSPGQLVHLGVEWCLAIGRPMGLVGLESADCAISAPLDGGLDDGLAFESSPDRFGVALPAGWILRWLDAGWSVPGQLINIATGERLDLGPFPPPPAP